MAAAEQALEAPEPEPVALGLVARAAPVAELAVAELAVAAAK